MDDPPPQEHSFVVKIWAKEVENPAQDAQWRGSVTHVGTGKRLYIKNLVQISAFLVPYVVEFGGSLDLRTRCCVWMAPSVRSSDPCV